MKRLAGATFVFVTLLCLSSASAIAADVLTPCLLKVSLFTNFTSLTVGELTADPRYPASPSEVRFLRSFNTRDALPTDALQDFGGRIEGFLTPQESGDYHFFLRSDHASQLWLSSDPSEAGAALIAEELDNGDPFLEPDTGDPATSAPVPLTIGQRYFIMVLYKGRSGGGNSTDVAQVAWRKVGDPTPALSLKPIPAAFLSTLASDAQGPSINVTQHPQPVTAEENSKAGFTVAAAVSPTNYVCIQWQRNGVNIPGATGTNYTRFLDKADDGAKFRAIVAVPGAFTNSLEASATVSDDQTRPVLLGAKGGPNRPEVTLMFSERLSPTSTTNLLNYRITGTNGTLGVTAAVLSDDRTQLTLSTDAQTPGTQYTVTVNSVTDLAATTPNVIATNSQATFFARGPWLQGDDGFVVWEAEDYDRNPDGLWFRDTERGAASGGVSMVNYNGAGGSENATKLEYDILFTKTGTNIIWGRASCNDGNDDSVWLHLDGQRPPERDATVAPGTLAAMSGFGSSLNATYGWGTGVQGGTAPMTFVINTPGLHTIGIATRENGAFMDKFVITTDRTFNPTTGFGPLGPSATLRQGEPLPEGVTVDILIHPVSTQAVENTSITLTAAASTPSGFLVNYQWQRKEGNSFVDLPGAGGTNFTINPLTLNWNGVVLRWRVISAGITKFSNEAAITVMPETTPPELLKATGSALQQRAVLFFSEPLNPTPATDPNKYRIDGPAGVVAVQTAALLPNGLTVVLETGAQTAGTKYTVTASGLTDTAATPNLIVKNQAKFYSAGQLLAQDADGLLVFEAENFDVNQGDIWIVDRSRGTPSGGASVVAVGADNDAMRVEYNLTFTQTGTHIVWFRGTGNSGSDDSGWLLIDGARPPERPAPGTLAAMTGFPTGPQADFGWANGVQGGTAPMTFLLATAGAHTFGLGLREDGAYFDKFAISSNTNFDPRAYGPFGPPETRAGVPPLPTLAITSPVTNAQFNVGASIPISVAISQTQRLISKVEFFSGTNKIGESLTSPFSFTWQNAPAGTNNLTAMLTDDVNDTVQSSVVPVIVAAPQLNLTAASAPGGLVLTWAGGAPPYTIEMKTRLSDASWTPVLSTNVTSATVVIQDESGFFRVSGATP
jgi:hypothetical protein